MQTVAEVIHRYTQEMEDIKPLGLSHRLTLQRIARESLGPIKLTELKKQNIIAYCQTRKDICAATRGQYVTYLSGVLKYAGAAWDDAISDAPIAAAKPFLKKYGLIGKSTPRDRRPSQDELEKLFDLFVEQNRRPKNRIDMVLIGLWQIASGRRIGETCALLWGDWNKSAHTILVRKMKDPRGKKSKVVALPIEAQQILEALEHARRAPEDPAERIFPYNSHSVSARYTEAKKIVGINGLRLHDSRRECASRLIEKGYRPAQAILVTGHETTAVFERTYMRLKPESFKDLPLAA